MTKQKVNAARVPNIQREVNGNTLVLTRDWQRSWGWLSLVIGAALLVFIVFAPSLLNDPSFDTSIFIPIILVIYGFMAALWFLNTTTLRVNDASLTLEEKPIPIFGKTFSSKEVEQLYIQQKRFRASVTYTVMVVTKNGHHSLITYLPTAEEAWYIEQEIEEFLGIQDAPVSGEYRS
jgi:hypothetical protein